MKQLFFLLLLIVLTTPKLVYANSTQAFADYRYQYDIFRIKDREYHVAIGEYKQYGTLASQQKAIDTAKVLLTQRNTTARVYLLMLNEKLKENPNMTPAERETYKNLLTNEIAFVENQTAQISAKNSLEELSKLADAYTKNTPKFLSSISQTIIGLEIGYLMYFAGKYDEAASEGQPIVTANSTLVPEKKAALDRWFLQIANKRSLFQQSITTIRESANPKSKSYQSQDQNFATIRTQLANAQQLLKDGVSYMQEIQQTLSYE